MLALKMKKNYRFLHNYEILEKYGGFIGIVYRRSLSLYFKYIRYIISNTKANIVSQKYFIISI